MFNRRIYKEILQWKEKYAPHYALFLKGARGVGKTTLAERLGKEAYKSYIRISFDQTEQTVKDLFVNSLRDLDTLFNTLQFLYGVRLFPRESLIILDEIQLFPQARQALKTLLEDGRNDYLETGFLAGICKKSKDILIPSEEYTLEVQPFDFEEFLWATGNEMTMQLIRESYAKLKPMGSAHQKIMKLFREFMIIGGMPESILAYIDTRDFAVVESVKQQILNFYKVDMEVQNAENTNYLRNLFDHIPSELSKQDKRFVLTHIDRNARIKYYLGPINWLEKAMITIPANNADDLNTSPNLNVIDPTSKFKCYLLDTGLLISLAYQNRPYLENELYKAILLDQFDVNKGMIVENAVAQILHSNGHLLRFYLEKTPDSRKNVIDIDFLIRKQNQITPIEVKSGKSKFLLSLQRFKEKFGKRVGTPIVLHHGEVNKKEDVIFLPYYMASVL